MMIVEGTNCPILLKLLGSSLIGQVAHSTPTGERNSKSAQDTMT